ncbi:hypothetical protein A3Q56_02828 [Intoshia linei]|uniref:Uncharacterized protein n=1 Tax=Intoshia linei TaxID=1819745 RepID=A0A177B576_9BILA|nr:hypothetical protein A3Q56_02828 [Intoshia linei]
MLGSLFITVILIFACSFATKKEYNEELLKKKIIIGCNMKVIKCDVGETCYNDKILGYCSNEPLTALDKTIFVQNVNKDVRFIIRRMNDIVYDPDIKISLKTFQCIMRVVVSNFLKYIKLPQYYIPDKDCISLYKRFIIAFEKNTRNLNSDKTKNISVPLNRINGSDFYTELNKYINLVDNQYLDNLSELQKYNTKPWRKQKHEKNALSDQYSFWNDDRQGGYNHMDENIDSNFENDEYRFIPVGNNKIEQDEDLYWHSSKNGNHLQTKPILKEKTKKNGTDVLNLYNLSSDVLYVYIYPPILNYNDIAKITVRLIRLYNLKKNDLKFVGLSNNNQNIEYKIINSDLNVGDILKLTYNHANKFKNMFGYTITYVGGKKLDQKKDFGQNKTLNQSTVHIGGYSQSYVIVLTLVLIGILMTIFALVFLCIRRRCAISKKFHAVIADMNSKPAGYEYQELCRDQFPSNKYKYVKVDKKDIHSSKFSLTSWNEDNVINANIDIITAHTVLAYMESYLNDGEKLSKEWELLKLYKSEYTQITIASKLENIKKNVNPMIVPYDHNRFSLNQNNNDNGNDYINASYITDHDPRSPKYIITQCPMKDTIAHFWQMVWESYSNSIVCLCNLEENISFSKYWVSNGSILFGIYEIHLISEHTKRRDYLIRCFYVKNVKTNETRTITQFHYNSWVNNEIPSSSRIFLEYRRKVEKSCKTGTSPTIIHCSNGAGRSGLFILIDIVINRIMKGVKQLDISATLEHLRDQRRNVIETKNQFEFAFTSIAEQVTEMINTIPN